MESEGIAIRETELFGRILGCLAGGAIGDAMGGATEMMHYETIERIFGEITGLTDYGATRETARFTPGQKAGQYTDDTRLGHILVGAIADAGGRITPDDLADAWKESMNGWFFIPVVNTYYKLHSGVRPRDAGRGNMGSNSTAMSIAPLGIVNACDPWQAAQDAYAIAGLVHEAHSRDAAAMIAAAVAASFIPGISAREVVDRALASVDRDTELVGLVGQALALADSTGDYRSFRQQFYETMLLDWPQTDIVDGTTAPPGFYDTAEPRETIPACLAMFVLANGDPQRAILHAANFGRDCDTIGSIVGGLAGAYGGIDSIPADWMATANEVNSIDLESMAERMLGAVIASSDAKSRIADEVRSLLA